MKGHEMMFDELNTLAAIALRDAVEHAIAHNEGEIRRKPAEGLRPDADAYFKAQHKERMQAIEQLKKVRRALHQGVFKSQAQ